RSIVAGEGEGLGASGGSDDLEALLVGQVDQDVGIDRIVLDDKQDGASGFQLGTVVRDRLRCVAEDLLVDRRGRCPRHFRNGARRTGVLEGQIESERAPGAWRAAQVDLSAQQGSQLAADGQPQARPAVLAAGSGLSLLESLKE